MEIDCTNVFVNELINSNKYDKNFNSTCIKVVEDIRSSRLTVVNLIEQLGSLLINTSPEKREHGLLILTRVLECLPKDFLNSPQLKFISAFYADRLKDHHQVVPAALKGILVLLNFTNLAEGCLTQILQSLFQHVSCQQQQQSDRFTIYKIFEYALQNKLQEVREMSFDFVYGILTAIDGERDPRNLLFLFSWLPKFIKSVTLGHLTEEMFEVIACYFPVDFKAPSDDPNKISRDSLAKALCPCLCSIDGFAQFCIPLALEKLSSSLKVAKLDSLDLLMEGCKTFSAKSYSNNSIEMWSLIQQEVLTSSDDEVIDKSLETLTRILNKLSHASTTNTFEQIVTDIVDTVKGNLRPDTRLFSPSSKILLHVAKASNASARYVVKDILPQLMNTYNITTTPSNQVLLLESIISFVKVYVELSGNNSVVDVKELAVVPSLCLKASVSPDDGIKKAGWSSIADIVESIPENVRTYIYENFRVILLVNQKEEVRKAVLDTFKKITKVFPLEVEQNVLNKVTTEGVVQLNLYLDALSEIASQPQVMENTLAFFVNSCSSYEDLSKISAVMKNLKKLLQVNKGNKDIYSFLLYKGHIVSFIVNLLCKDFEDSSVCLHEDLLINTAEVLECIIGAQESKVQKEILDTHLKPIISVFKETKRFALIVLLHGLLCRVQRNVLEDYGIMEGLYVAALNSDSDLIFKMSSELLANIVNKLQDENALILNLKKIEGLMQATIMVNGKNTVLLLSWLTKALIMRGHECASQYTNKLIQLLEEYRDAAQGFEIIMNDSCRCLSSESYCNRRLLYRQKFFTDIIEYLCKQDKEQFLLAVGYLLKETPKQVVVMHFKKILRAIILTLEKIDNAEVLCSILDILLTLLCGSEALFDDYVEEFIPRFLNLSRFEGSMKVRIKALQCLQAYTVGYTLHKLLPHKQLVIHGLSRCLDDPKRMVRKEAVLARNCWFLLDSPL